MKNSMHGARRRPMVAGLLVALVMSMRAVGMGTAAYARVSAPDYAFTVENRVLRMRDGVKLAVAFYMPTAKAGEKFPAIIEEVPYRKDDFFYIGDYEQCSYFAKRGYVFARVDVRGTGGSSGAIPEREYSEAELDDLVDVVGQLAKKPWSNGKVGMYGISWSAFNALMVASRKPPALKAIIAAHGSGDLFYNDVHYIDGALHFDLYCQQIDTDNALPVSPKYRTTKRYFTQRFNQTPWIFRYFREQTDGPFWRQESIDFKPPLEVPAFLVGGLLDGYRDFVPKIFERAHAVVKGDIGPWNHAWPDYGKPGPNYDWYDRAVRWWDYWLKASDTGILDEPRLMVFLRSGDHPAHLPSVSSGTWQTYATWPISGMVQRCYYPDASHALATAAPATGTAHQLEYKAGAGMAAGGWWGEQTGDMSADDHYSLVYDYSVVGDDVVVIGMPTVSVRVSADAPLYNWSVRLEDVWPEDGKVSLVSGCLINPLFRKGRLAPTPLVPGEEAILTGTIHFTTWRFKAGHKIRLAISNAQFPMAWPTPFQGSTRLLHGPDTWLELPLPPASPYPEPTLKDPPQVDNPPDAWNLYASPGTATPIRDDASGDSTYSFTSDAAWRIRNSYFTSSEFYQWSVNDASPATARYSGTRRDLFLVRGADINLACRFLIEADELNYYLTVNKNLFKNSSLIGDRTWWETIPRTHQTVLKTYQLDADTQGCLQQDGNIYNLNILSRDPLALKAEYEAGFVQGKLQKDKLPDARDNSFDGFALYQEGITSANPPTETELEHYRATLLENYDYTMNYISAVADAQLKQRLSRLAFRLLGIFDGATRELPQPLDFSGAWLPISATFTAEQLHMNYGSSTLSFMDIYFLNAVSDLADALPSASNGAARCSAFIRKTADDIYLGHTTWSCYLDRSSAVSYYINGDYLSMNASPFGIIGSNNDFGYNNKGIMFTETTHTGSGTPKTAALWMFWRSALAEQFAGSLDEFNRLVTLEASGTYMCGFMVADRTTRQIGLIEMSDKSFVYFRPTAAGRYEVITTPPGLSKKYDRDLLKPDYIIGINMPVSDAIRNELKSVESKPRRRQQFIAKIKTVTSIEAAKRLITYTAKNEPLSIFGRWDLGYGTTPSPQCVPSGSIDAKVVSASMIAYASSLAGTITMTNPVPLFWMKYGTASVHGKPFIWNESRWEGQNRRDIQNVLDGPWTLLNGYIH